MKRNLVFLMLLILLYLIPTVVLKASYGDSYSIWQGEDCWLPDQSGGWVRHGEPTSPMPTQPSVNIPVYQQYLPIFIPMLVLVLFLLTPLSRLLDDNPEDEEAGKDEEVDEKTEIE
ncbi:MAG: hypothetical protein P1R58_00210 [bacterium]|nr:hypothetical protein [bacterium]